MLLDLFRHRGWPYPRDKKQTWRLLIVLSLTITLTGVTLIWWLTFSIKQPLSRDEMRINAQDVISYIAQAKQLETIHTQQLAQNYRNGYMEELQKKVSEIHDSLMQSPIDPGTSGIADHMKNDSKAVADAFILLKNQEHVDFALTQLDLQLQHFTSLEQQL